MECKTDELIRDLLCCRDLFWNQFRNGMKKKNVYSGHCACDKFHINDRTSVVHPTNGVKLVFIRTLVIALLYDI